MAHYRIKIDGSVIDQAFDAAEAGSAGRDIWHDTEQRSLVLERRGRAVVWWLKTRSVTRRIGDAGRGYKGDHINPREARSRAARLLAELAAAPPADETKAPAPRPDCWTWSRMVTERLTLLAADRMVGDRIRIPSAATQDDVRRAFGVRMRDDGTVEFDAAAAPALVELQAVRLDDLTADEFMDAVRAVPTIGGRRKLFTYARAALSWAASNSHKSGFRVATPWWPALKLPDLEAAEIAVVRERKRKLAQRKADFDTAALGDMLARHEKFCLERDVSPGVRYGLWWVCLTAGRRGATTQLRRDDVTWVDQRGRDGWGNASWAEDAMKGRRPFMLPAPPIALRILWLAWHDFEARRRAGGDATQWVFASLRRVPAPGRTVDSADVATNPYSLATHLARMRGRRDGDDGVDVLAGVPDFSLHTIRTSCSNHLQTCAGVPAAAISAMLDHAPAHRDDDDLAPTTERYYSATQRMPLKSMAMEAWTEAVLSAFERAGGRLPEPHEPRIPRRIDVPSRPW